MKERICPHCEKNIPLESMACPLCHKDVPPLPNYPSLNPRWFLVLWGFFIFLIVGFVVSTFGAR